MQLPIAAVCRVVLARFGVVYPDHYDFIVAQLRTTPGVRAIPCPGGYGASQALVKLIADAEGL